MGSFAARDGERSFLFFVGRAAGNFTGFHPAGRGTFPAMGKYPKDRRGTAQDERFALIFALPPVPHYEGRKLESVSGISGAQNLSDTQNFRRATGPWVCKNCRWCGFTSAPGFAEPTCLVQNTDTSSAPFEGTFPPRGRFGGRTMCAPTAVNAPGALARQSQAQ